MSGVLSISLFFICFLINNLKCSGYGFVWETYNGNTCSYNNISEIWILIRNWVSMSFFASTKSQVTQQSSNQISTLVHCVLNRKLWFVTYDFQNESELQGQACFWKYSKMIATILFSKIIGENPQKHSRKITYERCLLILFCSKDVWNNDQLMLTGFQQPGNVLDI
jgi:hypothetical protein